MAKEEYTMRKRTRGFRASNTFKMLPGYEVDAACRGIEDQRHQYQCRNYCQCNYKTYNMGEENFPPPLESRKNRGPQNCVNLCDHRRKCATDTGVDAYNCSCKVLQQQGLAARKDTHVHVHIGAAEKIQNSGSAEDTSDSDESSTPERRKKNTFHYSCSKIQLQCQLAKHLQKYLDLKAADALYISKNVCSAVSGDFHIC